MNNYVKPAIKLATVEGALNNAGSCTTNSTDLELIKGIVGADDIKKAFAPTESCEFPLPLDMYCKFTSAEMGLAVVFWS